MNKSETPNPNRPSADFLDGVAEGVRRGLAMADNDPCPDGGRCPVPPMAEQRRLSDDEELADAHDRLERDDLGGSDE